MVRLLACVTLGLGLLSQGCASTCEGVSSQPVEFLAGITNEARTEYQSGRWDGEYLSFPANRRFDFVHGLHTVPTTYSSYLGFKPIPLEGDGIVSESAGNMVVLEEMNERIIGVRNDTCQQFYLRLTASVAPPDTPMPSGEGGAAGAPASAEGGAAGAGGAP